MKNQLKIIHPQTLMDLSDLAKASPRLRKNLNFHADDAAQCHRLLNALEPGTYLQPHRHLNPNKDETMIVLSGRFGVLIFDDAGQVVDTVILAQENGNLALTLPVGMFHSTVALATGSVFFESKAGPYAPLTDDEKASWAPAEGEPGCAEYLAKMLSYFSA
ncbi:WbuC family cupin fold metalloprotein [soil metagenome]